MKFRLSAWNLDSNLTCPSVWPAFITLKELPSSLVL